MGPFRTHCIDCDSAYAILRVWLCNSGALLPPSPPTEKATARQDQAGDTRPTITNLKSKSVLTLMDHGKASTLVSSSVIGGDQPFSGDELTTAARAKPKRAPQAKIRPARPAPAMGGGRDPAALPQSRPYLGGRMCGGRYFSVHVHCRQPLLSNVFFETWQGPCR